MSYGISVISTNGSEIIDGTYSGYILRSSGTLNLSGDPNIVDVVSGSIPLPSGVTRENALIAVMPQIGAGFSYDINNIIGSDGSSLQYKVFGPQSASSPSDEAYGARVWNSSGSLVFDSGNTTFSVMSSHQPIMNIPSDPNVSVSNPGNQWLVLGTGGGRGYTEIFNGQYTGFFTGFAKREDGYVEFYYGLFDAVPKVGGDGTVHGNKQCSMMRVNII